MINFTAEPGVIDPINLDYLSLLLLVELAPRRSVIGGKCASPTDYGGKLAAITFPRFRGSQRAKDPGSGSRDLVSYTLDPDLLSMIWIKRLEKRRF